VGVQGQFIENLEYVGYVLDNLLSKDKYLESEKRAGKGCLFPHRDAKK
jgi:hypothetical protein